MAFDDSLIGTNDFDPRSATEDLIRQQSDEPLPDTLDPRMLNTRLARKMGRERPTRIERPTPQQPLDLSDFAPAGAPDQTAAPTAQGDLDLSDFAPVEATAVPTPKASASDYPVEFGKGVVEGAKNMGASSLKGIAAVVPEAGAQPDYDALGNAIGTNDAMATGAQPVPMQERQFYKAGQAVEDYGKQTLAAKPGFENSWTRDIGQGAGSMLTGIPLSMIPGIGPVLAGTLYTTSGMGEAVDNAVKGKASTSQTESAAMLGGIAGATDMIDTVLPFLGGSVGRSMGFIKRVGIAAVKGAMMEGGQEGVQQLMQNAIAKGIYKPDQDLFEDVPRSVAIAAILGGVVGGGGAALHRDQQPAQNGNGTPPANAGTLPPGGPAPGGPRSSPEDIRAFNEQARQTNPNPPHNGPTGPRDPATMDDAELSAAFQQARADMGDASLEEILRAGGYSPDTISHMDDRGKVEEAIGISRAYKYEAEQKKNGPATGTESTSPKSNETSPDHREYAVLREYGYSDEDIGNMPAAQRKREVVDALAEGIDPTKAMAKHQPPAATQPTGAKVDREGAAGTRADPIKPQTADDVLKAQPVEPKSPAQAEAENYQHAHMELPQFGLTGSRSISIETGVGQERKGIGADGKPWSITMEHAAYGRLKGTEGADFVMKDGKPTDKRQALDTFVGPHPTSQHAFIIDQHHPEGGFDEHKIMLGFRNPIEAMHAYVNSYNDLAKDRIGGVTAMGPEEFKTWLAGDTTKALSKTPTTPVVSADEGAAARTHFTEADGTGTNPSVPKGSHAEEAGLTSTAEPTDIIDENATNSARSPTNDSHNVVSEGAEPTAEHHGLIEAALGQDYNHVAEVDIHRAAELMAENDGMPAETAFGQAVIENAVEQGFITEQQAEAAYGDEVKDVLDAGREGPSGGSENTEHERAASDEVSAGGAEETGVVPSGGEAVSEATETSKPAETTGGEREPGGTKPETAEQPATGGEQAAGDETGDTAEHQPAAEAADDTESGVKSRLFRLGDLHMEVNPDGHGYIVMRGEETIGKPKNWGDTAQAFHKAAIEAGHPEFDWYEGPPPAVEKVKKTKPTAGESVLDEVEKNKITDAGEKIGGARKDAWIGRGLSFDDLEGMTGVERDKNLTKHNIWQRPDYVQAVADGVDPVAAALIKRLYDRLPVKPNEDRYRGQEDSAKAFIKALGVVRDVVKDIKTVEDAKDIGDRVELKLDWRERAILYPARSTINPLIFDSSDIRAATRAVEDGFPEMAPWQRLFQVTTGYIYPDQATRKQYADFLETARKLFEAEKISLDQVGREELRLREWHGTKIIDPETLTGEIAKTWQTLFDLHVRNGNRRIFNVSRKNGGRIGEPHLTRELAEAAAKAEYDKLGEERKKGGEEPKRPHLDQVNREGPDYRKDRDVTGEDFVADFGFRGVEFGNWVAGDERQKVVNLAYDALHDLARALNVPAKALSLNGTLSVGFGSRGRGGRAAAHYEPDRIVINMTKLSGAGSLAHEFGHALDHYLGELNQPNAYGGKVRSITGWDETLPTGTYKAQDFLHLNQHLPKKLRAAVNRLMHDIFTVEEDDANFEQRLAREIEDGKKGQQSWIERARKLRELKGKGHSAAGLKQAETQIQIWGRSIEKLESALNDGKRKQVASNYLKEATKLSGTTGDYWRRPNELFARAFESYVHDKIAGEGFESQYLVQGVEPNRFGNGFKGNPYPSGDERKTINADFDRVVRGIAVGEGKHGAGSRIEGATGEPEPVQTVVKVKKPQEQPSGESEAEAVAPATLTGAFQQHFTGGKGFAGILEARKFAKERGFTDDPKAIEEAMEAAIVRTARFLVDADAEPDHTFKALVALYGRQPRLGTRTSTSVRDQAYSTPVPLAYLAARLAGITKETTVYEPSAGNGALLITADPAKAITNELNEQRRKNLREQGFQPMPYDASTDSPVNQIEQKGVDAVIANPPFGSVKENGETKVFDLRNETGVNYQTSEIDHAIALKALEAMKDDGRAVLLLGGINKLVTTPQGRADAYNGKAKREFFKALYDNYNVTDHFTVSGDLYEKQGAGWPVDVVVINGRGKAKRPLPAVKAPRIYNAWDELGGLVNGQQTTSGVRSAGEQAGVTSGTGPGVEGSGGSNRRRSGGNNSGVGEPAGVRNKPESETAGPRPTSGGERSEPEGLGQGNEPARPGEQSAAVDDFDAAFEAALDAAYGSKAEPKPAGKPRDQRSTPEVIKSAGENVRDAADEAFSALADLFGGNKLSMGVSFDEQTYAKAKPHFEAAANKFSAFKGDLRELLNRMVAHLRDVLRWSREAMEKIGPYLKRFITDLHDAANEAPRKEALKAEPTETENQVVYKPRSNVNGLDTLAPVNMAKPMADSLTKLEERVGQIDTFVMKELGYTPKQLEKYFGAEQVDALGLAIDNIKNGKGFIIGDQTGIGKGRVNAAIIRWAIKNDRMPVFVTEKPNLYKDMFRDLMDTGISDGFLDDKPRILATNAALKLPLEEGNGAAIKTGDAKAHNAHLLQVAGNVGEHYDMVFTTYNQMQTQKGEDTARRQFLTHLANRKNGIVMIFDESHNAGGQKDTRGKAGADGAPQATGRAGFSRELIQKANGVFYSSATYAKRPDVMDLYAATDMKMAVDNISDLAEAIARGGVPMQQAVASMLAKAGQYMRRERSFAGINYNTPLVPVDRATYDDISRALSGIQDLSAHVSGAAGKMSKEIRAEGEAMGYDGSTGEAGASSTNFTSVMHNVINQMLLAMKADHAANLAIEAIKRGEKPVLTVANTMEAFLKDYSDNLDLKPGDAMPGDFGHVLRKYLDRTRTVLIKRPFKKQGEKPKRHYLNDQELGPAGVAVYKRAMEIIDGMDLSGMPISPIDYIKGKIKKAGYDTGEITGRTLAVDYTGDVAKSATRSGSEKTASGRTETLRRFNTRPKKGGFHALLINQAGSTGLSAHASSTFDDQSKRRMIVVQPEANIDTHMQLLGRINRTGQVVLPEYDQLVADIPAEKRPAAVLSKKMASLNANTTASRSSAVTAKDVPDFINQYGDEVAASWVRDNPDAHYRLASPVAISEEGKVEPTDAMRKLTGRLPLLRLEQQEAHYQELESAYAALLAQLEAAGENALEAKSYDLKARLVEYMEVQGKRNNSGSPFAAPVILQKVSIARIGKPFKPGEILDRVGQAIDPEMKALGGEQTDQQLATTLKGINDPYNILGKKVRQIESAERVAALKRYADYTRPILDAEENAEDRTKQMVKFNETKDRWTALHQMVPIGRRVVIKTATNNITGIVLGVEQQGEPKNPLALGSWKVTFAIADASRQMTIPFSRLYENGNSNPDSLLDVEIEPMNDWYEHYEATLDKYQHMQSEAREDRWIAGGNILSGYDWLDRKGAIINYTSYKGTVHQGVLTARGFDPIKQSVNHGTVEKDPAKIKAFLDDTVEKLSSKDGNLAIQKDGRYGSDYVITAQKSKSKGGVYFLDKDLIRYTGEFASKGGNMVAYARGSALIPAIQRMQALGAQFKMAASRPETKKVTPKPDGENDPNEPSLASIHTPIDEPHQPESDAEREERLDELADTLRKLVRHIIGPEFEIRFNDGLIQLGQTPVGYSDDVGTVARGVYTPSQMLIRVALTDAKESGTSALHESFHGLEDRLLTDHEIALMQRETPRMRQTLKGGKVGLTDDQVDRLSGFEVRSHVFQQYGMGKITGDKLHTGVRRWFDRLLRLLRAVANAVRGLGFKTYEDIFDTALKGKYAKRPLSEYHGIDTDSMASLAAVRPGGNRRGPPSQSETIAEHLRDRGHDRLAGLSQKLGIGKFNTTEARTLIQDKMIRVRKAEESVGNHISSLSAYQAESLYYGRTGERLEALEKAHFDPVIEAMHQANITPGEINAYLYARHAPERNAYIDTINPNLGGEGSGMSDADAAAVMAGIPANKLAQYRAIAAQIDRIISDTLDNLVGYGLISQETADDWRNQYQHYVPLRGFAEGTEDEALIGRGKGYDTRGKESKAAFGRASEADGPLHYVMMQAESAIVRGEKNRVGNTFLRFIRANPDPDRWQVNAPTLKRRIDPQTGLVTHYADFNYHNEPDAFVTKVGGKPMVIRLYGKDGMNIARALKQMGASNMNNVVKLLHTLTTLQSRLSTQWNPNFTLPNFARDLGEAFINLQEQDQRRFVTQFAKHVMPAMKGAFHVLSGKAAGGVYADAFRAFDKAGGRIRFFGLDDPDDIKGNIARKMRKLEGGVVNNALGAGAAIGHGFEIVNGAVENAPRLAAFMAARDVGMSIPDAAMLARNLTVDFNKKGEWGPAINAAFMFANANIQGGARLGRALMHKRVRRAAYALVAMGAAGALYNILAGGDDDDGEPYYSKIKPYIRDKNLIFMWPKGFGADGKYGKIPLPYGFSPFHVIGDRFTALAMGKDKVTAVASALLSSIADAFNPLGEESSAWMMLVPSLLRPGIHIAMNKNWTGNPLYPEHDYDKTRPDSEKSFYSNSDFAKAAARGLNSASGGSPYKSGWFDVHPGSIDHVLETITGGLGKFIMDVVKTGGAAIKGEPFDETRAPIIRRFVGDAKDPKADASSYYEARDEARKAGGENLRAARKDMGAGIHKEEAESFVRDNAGARGADQLFKHADKQMQPLRERLRRIEESEELSASEKQGQKTDITERMRQIQNITRKRYRELKDGASQ